MLVETYPRQLVVQHGLGEGLETADQPVHGDLVAFEGAAFELWSLGIVAQLDTHLVGSNGVLHMADILAQITFIHMLNDKRGPIVFLVQ